VAVYPGYAYDVLLLAGSTDYQCKTLLAAGYSEGSYTLGAEINLITPGENNVIGITINAFPLLWDTSKNNAMSADNDFAFITYDAYTSSTGSLGNVIASTINNRNIHISPTTTSTIADASSPIADAAVIAVTFRVAKLAALLGAEKTGTELGAISLVPKITLNPLSGGSNEKLTFDAVSFISRAGTNATTSLDIYPATSTNRYYIISGHSNATNAQITFVSDTSVNKLPKNNKDGLLVFELEYRAFGTTVNEGTTLWTIRNGLNDKEDTAAAASSDTTGDTDGGAFRVKFGAGAPADLINAQTPHKASPF
jgi:hypothetical protein